MRGSRSIWNEMTDRFILENYGRMPKTEIARRLGVSPRSVVYRARKLGIPPITYTEALRNEDFRKAVGEKISRGQSRSTRMRRYLVTNPEIGEKYRFQKGHRVSEEGQRKAARRKRKIIYDELVRMKYGLSQRTAIKLKPRQHIDRKKYFPEEE